MSNRYILITSSGGVNTGVFGLHQGDEFDYIDFDDHKDGYDEWRYDFDAAMKGWVTADDDQARKRYRQLIDLLLDSAQENGIKASPEEEETEIPF